MAAISVIIPVYNAEDYLNRCLNSLVNQTLKDIEIICVNDCSTDNSLKILQNYALKDTRIRIIDFKENKGAAIARNKAIEDANGEYIGFVDSDDFIDLDFYEKLYNTVSKNNTNIAIGNLALIDENLQLINRMPDFIKNIKQNKYFFTGFFGLGIYKKELLSSFDIKFIPDLKYGEDRLLPIQAVFHTENLPIVENTYYHYFQRDNSTSKLISKEKLEDFRNSTNIVLDFLQKHQELTPNDYICIMEGFIPQALSLYYEAKNLDNTALINLFTDFINKIPSEVLKYFDLDMLNLNSDNDQIRNQVKKIISKQAIKKIRKMKEIK